LFVRDTDEILCCLRLGVKEIGANHSQIDVRFAMFVLIAPIGAEPESLQAVALPQPAKPGERVSSNPPGLVVF
jgi:hypothetical protein